MVLRQQDKENVMAVPTKPEALQDEEMDEVQGAAPKLQEKAFKGTFYPESTPTHAVRKSVPVDGLSINVAKSKD